MAERPKPPGLDSLFATALATTPRRLADDPGAHTHALTCSRCGAPRQDAREDAECQHCGHDLFEPTP